MWIEILKEFQADHFAACTRPVVLLVMSFMVILMLEVTGSFQVILDLDFIEIEGWPSLFWNPSTKVVIVAHVDDFKVAGPKQL